MIVRSLRAKRAGAGFRRRGLAAVEFSVCLPLLLVLIYGMWEMGRLVEIQQVAYNATREGARDASIGHSDLLAVTNNVVLYLQGGDPTAFGSGHSTSLISPVITLPANTYGYTVWDNTANKELFTLTFKDTTNTAVTDPTDMSQLDVFTITVSYPPASNCWVLTSLVSNFGRYYATATWASMVDSPFSIVPSLPAQ